MLNKVHCRYMVELDELLRFWLFCLEQFLTRTVWWAIPVIWLPVICWCISMSVRMGHTPSEIALMVGFGIFIWTLLEYSLHRFVFHIKTKSYWLVFSFFLEHLLMHVLCPQTSFHKSLLLFPKFYWTALLSMLGSCYDIIVLALGGTPSTILFMAVIISTLWMVCGSFFLQLLQLFSVCQYVYSAYSLPSYYYSSWRF